MEKDMPPCLELQAEYHFRCVFCCRVSSTVFQQCSAKGFVRSDSFLRDNHVERDEGDESERL